MKALMLSFGILAWLPQIIGWVALSKGDLFSAIIMFSYSFGFGLAALYFGNKPEPKKKS